MVDNGTLQEIAQRMPRRMMPPSMRRAVAIAIELERTHDHLAAYAGSAPPISDRIAVQGSTTAARRGRLVLPRDLSLEILSAMQERRMAAIDRLYDDIGPTLDTEEAASVATFVSEAREMTSREQRPAPGRRPRHRTPRHDGLGADQMARMMICDMADERIAPQPPIAPQPERWRPPVLQPGSISIELIVDGLMKHLGIDPDVLYAELDTIRTENGGKEVSLASPSARSNFHRTLHALGPAFPPAVFRLRGPSLDTVRMELSAADPEDYLDVWTYSGGHVARPMLTRHGALRGMPIHTFPRRSVADALGDPRFHHALVIDRATREVPQGGSEIRTVLGLFPRYALLDPPGRHVERPEPVAFDEIADDLRAHRDIAVDVDYEAIIDEALRRRGHPAQFVIRTRYDQRLSLTVREKDREWVQHTYLVDVETLQGGAETIDARVGEIMVEMKAFDGRRSERMRQQEIEERRQALYEEERLKHMRRIAERRETEETTNSLRRERFAQSFPAALDLFDQASHMDAFLAAMLEEQWSHPYVAATSEATFRLVDGCLMVDTARLGDHASYRIMQVRDYGIPSVLVQIEIDRILDGSVMAELEGAPLGRLLKWGGSAFSWPIRRIERVRSRTVMTFEVSRVTIRNTGWNYI